MANGKLDETAINVAALFLLAEWNKQEKEHKYKVHRLRDLFRNLSLVMVLERDAKQ